MYLLIEVGGYIGAWPTIALVMLTAVIGVSLLRIQGFATLTRGMSRLQSGELPATEVVEGLLLAVAGALLLTPGFVTDGVGFVLLTPVFRREIARKVLARVQVTTVGGFEAGGYRQTQGFEETGAGRPDVIEGDFESLDEDENRPPNP